LLEEAVSLRQRLARLEARTTAAQERGYSASDTWEWMQCWEAYLRGEGPKPAPLPCPSWFDPAAWDSRQRLADYLATGQPPPGLTDEEKAYIDGLQQEFDEWERSLQEGGRDTAHPIEPSGAEGARERALPSLSGSGGSGLALLPTGRAGCSAPIERN
jgi:hypothetical protein